MIKKDYYLIIMPTLDCNFKCWYCIQDHIPSKMSENTLEKLKNHIKYMIEEKGIESLHISWFGGEPFMYYHDIIRPLNIFAKDYCSSKGIPFYSSATTNGSLVTKDIAKDFQDISLLNFQTTLDRRKSLHDQIKFANGIDSAFETTLTNLRNILELNPDFSLLLRINYTSETLESELVDEVDMFIPKELRKRVRVILKKVWQEKSTKDRFSTYVDIVKKFRQHGYIANAMDFITNFLPCYTNALYYNAINFNGHAMKCTACDDPYLDKARGVLLDNGMIQWHENFDKKYLCKSFENEKCIPCKLLPICMGLCPRDHNAGLSFCKYTHSDVRIEDSIIDLIESELEMQ